MCICTEIAEGRIRGDFKLILIQICCFRAKIWQNFQARGHRQLRRTCRAKKCFLPRTKSKHNLDKNCSSSALNKTGRFVLLYLHKLYIALHISLNIQNFSLAGRFILSHIVYFVF